LIENIIKVELEDSAHDGGALSNKGNNNNHDDGDQGHGNDDGDAFNG
jgi:hypothetical protein